jgi:TolB-like protein/cytochrome c-type biogenesis protein CcmH/NrfG
VGGSLAEFSEFVSELRRRRVFRALAVWGVVAFAVLQIYEPVMHGLHLPEWTLSFVVVALGLGFPVTAALAWVFDLKASGIEKTPDAAEPGSQPRPRAGRRVRLAALVLGIGTAAAAPGLVYFFVWPGAGRRTVEGAASSPGVKGAPSIAVLPFANLSSDKDQEYFADGIAEEILNALAQIDGLRVAGRTSSFAFKGRNEDLAGIAQKLRVGTVLEGSVRKDGNRVRVTAQLINAGDGYHLWSQTFDRELTGVFAIQDEISRAVVAALKGRLVLAGAAAPPTRPTTNPEAYSKFLLGRHFIGVNDSKGMAQAVAALEQSVALDPGYAPAWASLAYASFWLVQFETTAKEQASYTARAKAAADRAVALAPDLADGYAMRGFLRVNGGWDWAGAEADMDKALALGLGDASLLRLNARFVMAPQGRLGEAVAALQRVVERDPLSSSAWSSLGTLLTYQKRHDEAAAAFRRSLEIAPGNPIAQSLVSFNLALQKRGEESLAAAREVKEEGWRLTAEAFAFESLGRRPEAEKAIADLKEKEGGTMAYQVASFHAWRGEVDESFRWLDRALRQDDGGLSDILIDPDLNRMRADPRYQAILVKMHLSPSAVVR